MKNYLQDRMNHLDQISRLFCAVLVLSIVGIWGIYFAYGLNAFCNEITLLLGSLFLIMLIAEIVLVDASLKAPVTVLVFIQASTCIPGVLSLLLIPDTVYTPLTLDGVNKVNQGLSYLCIGLLAFCLCLLLANHLFTANDNDSFHDQMRKMESSLFDGRRMLVLLSTMFLLILLSRLPYLLGVNQYHQGQYAHMLWNSILQIQVLLFDPDSITLLAAYSASRMNITLKQRLKLLVTISCLYLSITILGGSRSGLMRLLIFFLIIALVVEIQIKIKWKTFFIALGALIAGGMVVFVLATYVRLKLANIEYIAIGNHPPIEKVIAKPHSAEHPLIDIHPDLADAFAKGIVTEVASRLAVPFFSAIQITTHEADKVAQQRYFTLEYALKNVANNLPGTPIPEAEVNTSRLFGVIYRGQTEEQVLKHGYFSEFYTAWGLSYLFFGWWGGLSALAVLGFLFGFIFVCIYKHRQKHPFLQLWALLILPGSIFLTQGLDHTLWLLIVTSLRITFAVYILQFFFNLSGSNCSLKTLLSLKSEAKQEAQ